MKIDRTSFRRSFGGRRHSKRQAFASQTALIASVALAFFALCSTGLVKSSAGQDESDPVVSTESAETGRETSTNADIPVNWLPDLHVPSGSPETRVDLSVTERQFCERNFFGASEKVTPDKLEWRVVLPEEDAASVADVEVNDDMVFLRWKEGAVGKTKILLEASVKGDETRKAYAAFNIDSWKPDYLKMFAAILGGLGLFLLGMKKMSEGLTAIAGARLRRLISVFTNNCFLAVGLGIVTTTLVQSSSATSVMTLGFVNSGLMKLEQAMGVIIGTHIGTTTTGWLLTFNIGATGLPILGVAALVLIFFKRERVVHIATFTLGVGMIFFGLETLKHGMAPLSELPEFSELIQATRANTMVNVGKCVLIGTVVTMLVQSSAVTMAIVITLASLGSIDLNSSAAIVLGSNVGTTITALLASVGANANARRVAYFHTASNAFGVLWVWAVFFVFLIPAVNYIGDAVGMRTVVGKIALTHTFFNVVNTIVLMPLIKPASRLFERLVKDDEERIEEDPSLKWQKLQLVNVSGTTGAMTNITNSRKVVQDMFFDCHRLFEILGTLRENNFSDSELTEKAFKLEDKLDHVQDDAIDFVSKVTVMALSPDLAASAREQIRLAEELETISDYIIGILKSNLKLKADDKLELPDFIADKETEFLRESSDALQWLSEKFGGHIHDGLTDSINARRDQLVGAVKETRDMFMQHMFDDKIDPLVIIAVEFQLNAWRRVFEHIQNIAEAMEEPGRVAPLSAAVAASRRRKAPVAKRG